MKSLITYFSHSGHSEQVAKQFENILKEKGEVEIQRLLPKNEIKNFFLQCLAARKKEKAELPDNIKTDVTDYDLVVIGSPVWAFAPTPAINAYLDKISDFKGKNIVLFLTSGGTGWVEKVFQYMESQIQSKNPGKILRLNILDKQLKNDAEVTAKIQEVIASL